MACKLWRGLLLLLFFFKGLCLLSNLQAVSRPSGSELDHYSTGLSQKAQINNAGKAKRNVPPWNSRKINAMSASGNNTSSRFLCVIVPYIMLWMPEAASLSLPRAQQTVSACQTNYLIHFKRRGCFRERVLYARKFREPAVLVNKRHPLRFTAQEYCGKELWRLPSK